MPDDAPVTEPKQPTDEEIRAFEAEAKSPYAKRPPVGSLETLDGLIAEMTPDSVLFTKAQVLCSTVMTDHFSRIINTLWYA